MNQVPDMILSSVEVELLWSEQLTADELAARLGEPMVKVRQALRALVRDHLAHAVKVSPKVQAFRWGPVPRESVATGPVPQQRTDYVPPIWTNEIARPGGEANRQLGSLQPDGTVKPYHRPMHGCVGHLKDKTSNHRD